MPHVIEPAASGRAKCRGCGEAIAKDELRFGERLPNPFGEGEMTLWFHPVCGVYKRPEPFLEALDETEESSDALGAAAGSLGSVEGLRDAAGIGIGHRRLPRVDGGHRSPTGRAHCRSCREPIDKDAWRIGLIYFEEGYFNPSGFIHARCWRDYFEAEDLDSGEVIRRIEHFSPELIADDLGAIQTELEKA